MKSPKEGLLAKFLAMLGLAPRASGGGAAPRDEVERILVDTLREHGFDVAYNPEQDIWMASVRGAASATVRMPPYLSEYMAKGLSAFARSSDS